MGTTPQLAIPYVEPADKLANYPNQDKAQADRLEALLAAPLTDSGWVNITINPGFTADGAGAPQVRKIGKMIYTRGGWSNTGLINAGDYQIGVVPAGYIPIGGVMFNCVGSGGAPAGRLDWGYQTGAVRVRVAATNMTSYFKINGFCWPID